MTPTRVGESVSITVTQEVPSGTSPASLSTLDRDYAYTLTTTGKLCALGICSMIVVIEPMDKGHFGSTYFAIYSEGIIIVSLYIYALGRRYQFKNQRSCYL